MPFTKVITYFLCALAVFYSRQVAKADPIILNATSVFANYNHVDTYQVSGPGFSFSGTDLGNNLPYPFETGSGELVEAYGYVTSGGYSGGQLEAQLHGFIDGVPAYFFGSAHTPFLFTSLPPTDLSVLPQIISFPLTISGSFTACLQPENVGFGAGCDPDFLNYAVVNVNLPGSYNILLDHYGNPPYPEPWVTGLTYTAAATPEPSSVALVIAGSLLVFCIGKIRSGNVRHSPL